MIHWKVFVTWNLEELHLHDHFIGVHHGFFTLQKLKKLKKFSVEYNDDNAKPLEVFTFVVNENISA